MTKQRGVLFDLGGTLLEYVPDDESWQQMEARGSAALHRLLADHGCGVQAEVFHQALFERILEAWERGRGGLGSASLHELIEIQCRDLGVQAQHGLVGRAVEAYCESAGSAVRAYPGAAEVLAHLKGRGLKVGLISNTLWDAAHHRRDLERFGLLPYFDDLVFSSECGYWKPNAWIFSLALERLRLEPGQAVFIGDRLVDDVGGAVAAGLKGVLRESTRLDTDYERGRELGIEPHGRVRRLSEFPAVLEQMGYL